MLTRLPLRVKNPPRETYKFVCIYFLGLFTTGQRTSHQTRIGNGSGNNGKAIWDWIKIVSLSCKALLTLALSMLVARSNGAPYMYTTSATTSSIDWVTEDLPLSDLMYFFFPTGTGD